MPITIMPESQSGGDSSVVKLNHKYKYPAGLNLHPDSPAHKKLVKLVLDRARYSHNAMSKKYAVWRELDRVLSAFVTESTYKNYQRLVEQGKMSAKSRKFQIDKDAQAADLEIVFPYSHTILETLLAFMVVSFLKDPIFGYSGVGGPADIVGAKLMELVVQAHCKYNKVGLALHTFFRDAFVYGIGVVALTWKEKYGFTRQMKPKTFFGIQIGEEQVVERTLLREGNALVNVDPFSFLPDPNVQLHKLNEGEFVGYVEDTNYITKLGEERASGRYFNVEYLKQYPYARTVGERRDRNEVTKTTNDILRPVSDIHMYIDLIPSEHELGSSTSPEKWYFCLSNESVITQAMPAGFDHDDYPFAVITPDFDGHSLLPISRMEIPYGLQTTLDWTFNTYIRNASKAVNDVFIVDPFLVNMRDVESPAAGKIIRTTKAAWGRGVKDVMTQLPVSDITRGMLGDGQAIMQYMERSTGADAASQGMMRQSGPERLTEAEVNVSQQGLMNRLSRITYIVSAQGMDDIGRMFAFHTKQFISKDVYYKLTADSATELINTYGIEPIMIDPESLMIDFDIETHDGTNASMYNNVWTNLFKLTAADPELRQTFDVVRIFKQVAMGAGAKDVSQFVRMRQMVPEQVMNEQAKGNLVSV